VWSGVEPLFDQICCQDILQYACTILFAGLYFLIVSKSLSILRDLDVYHFPLFVFRALHYISTFVVGTCSYLSHF